MTSTRGIFPLALHDVGAVDPGGVDPDADAIGGWMGRRRDFLQTNRLASAVGMDHNRALPE